jgi:hypothetical protein
MSLDWISDDSGRWRSEFEREGRRILIRVGPPTPGKQSAMWPYVVEIHRSEGGYRMRVGSEPSMEKAKESGEAEAAKLLAGDLAS